MSSNKWYAVGFAFGVSIVPFQLCRNGYFGQRVITEDDNMGEYPYVDQCWLYDRCRNLSDPYNRTLYSLKPMILSPSVEKTKQDGIAKRQADYITSRRFGDFF
jgi:hypothetical protein